jgi:hypothetical protein
MPRRDEDEDDLKPKPKKRVVRDDDDERPVARKRKVESEDDLKPKPKKRVVRDDDEDDRPRKRKTRVEPEEDEDDRPTIKRRSYDEDDYEDEPKRKKKKRPVQKEPSVVGIIALVVGVLSLLLAIIPCIGSIGLYPGILGVIIGFIGLVISQKSEGRQGPGMSISAMSVSFLAIVIAIGWMFFMKKVEKEIDRMDQQAEANYAREEAKRKGELAKAADEVKAAQPGTVLRVSAFQFYKAYDDDEDGDRADRIYKNKIIEVTGTFHEVNFAGDEGYIVLLKAGGEFASVDCTFAKDPAIRTQLAKLAPGSMITIRGKCLGGSASLEACILVTQ